MYRHEKRSGSAGPGPGRISDSLKTLTLQRLLRSPRFDDKALAAAGASKSAAAKAEGGGSSTTASMDMAEPHRGDPWEQSSSSTHRPTWTWTGPPPPPYAWDE